MDNWKWGDTGKLPDEWAWNEVHPVWLEEIRDENRALYEVILAAGHCHGQDIAAFLCFLSVRLLEMHSDDCSHREANMTNEPSKIVSA